MRIGRGRHIPWTVHTLGPEVTFAVWLRNIDNVK